MTALVGLPPELRGAAHAPARPLRAGQVTPAGDHGPAGVLVRRRGPELGTRRCPAPAVDARAAVAVAQERLRGLRRRAGATQGELLE